MKFNNENINKQTHANEDEDDNDSELERLYAQYSHQVEEGMKFGDVSDRQSSVQEEIEYEPEAEEEYDSELEKNMKNVERKLTEIRNKRELDQVEEDESDKVDDEKGLEPGNPRHIMSSSQEYDSDMIHDTEPHQPQSNNNHDDIMMNLEKKIDNIGEDIFDN